MPDIVASQLPPGAGRFLDYVWPDSTQDGAALVGASFRSRTGSGPVGGVLVAIGGGLGAAASMVAGVPCTQLVSNVADIGNQRIFYPGFPVTLRTSKSNISALVDDCSVYRFRFSMCRNGAACGANADLGFELVAYSGGVASRIDANGINGIGIRLQSANVVQLLIRGPNGLVVTDLTAAPFNIDLEWHFFDMIFYSATPTTDARWRMEIDGAPVTLSDVNSNWGAVGTNLPAAAVNAGGNIGFAPTIVSTAKANTGLFVQALHMIAAPSELMTQ